MPSFRYNGVYPAQKVIDRAYFIILNKIDEIDKAKYT